MGFLRPYLSLHLYSYQSSLDFLCTIFVNSPSVAALVIYCYIIYYPPNQELKLTINRISLVLKTSIYFFLFCCLCLRLPLGSECPFPLARVPSPTFIFLLNYLLSSFKMPFRNYFAQKVFPKPLCPLTAQDSYFSLVFP